MKKKKEAAAVSVAYIVSMSVLYMIPRQIDNFSAYLLGAAAAFLVMYIQDRRNTYQKIFLAVTFFSIRWLAVAMAGRLDDFIKKALVFNNAIAGREWLQYGLYCRKQGFGAAFLHYFYSRRGKANQSGICI